MASSLASPAAASIAARTAARVPDAGKAHSEAAGFPSTSAMMNCETCHHEDVLVRQRCRSTNAKALQLVPAERDVEPAARQRAALRCQDDCGR